MRAVRRGAEGGGGHAPTRVSSALSDEDVFLFNEGTHRRLAGKLGATLTSGVEAGVTVRGLGTQRPRVAVIGDFNGWDEQADPLQSRGSSGIWEGVVAPARASESTSSPSPPRRERAREGRPFAVRCELPPRTGSVVWDLAYVWGDDAWMGTRGERMRLDAPGVGLRGPPRELAPRPGRPRRCSATARSPRGSSSTC